MTFTVLKKKWVVCYWHLFWIFKPYFLFLLEVIAGIFWFLLPNFFPSWMSVRGRTLSAVSSRMRRGTRIDPMMLLGHLQEGKEQNAERQSKGSDDGFSDFQNFCLCHSSASNFNQNSLNFNENCLLDAIARHNDKWLQASFRVPCCYWLEGRVHKMWEMWWHGSFGSVVG